MTQRIVEIGCMDPRTRNDIDNGPAVARFSRAGGWVGGIKAKMPDFLRRHSINIVKIKTHSDCGAAKVVQIGLDEGSRGQVAPQIHDTIIDPFRRHIAGMRVSTEDIEDIGTMIQQNIALDWLRHRGGVKSLEGLCCTKIKTVGKVEGRKTLLITPPVYEGNRISDLVSGLGLDNSTTYVVTLLPTSLEQMAIDPMLAINHIKGMDTVAFHAGSIDRESGTAIDAMHNAAVRGLIRLGNADIVRLD